MKFTILLQMLFDLLAQRKVTASYFASKYSVSERTVYRYVDCLAMSIPLYVKRGRAGGICLSDSYKLPAGFMTSEEYEAVLEALSIAYARSSETRFLEAKHKLSSQLKEQKREEAAISGETGSILVDGGVSFGSRGFADKLRLFEESIKEHAILEIGYSDPFGEKTRYKIEPHVLIFKQNVWYVYAFCRVEREFRVFRLGRIYSGAKNGEHFQKRPFRKEDIVLNPRIREKKTVDIRLLISPTSVSEMQNKLGIDVMQKIGDDWYADIVLSDDPDLITQILSLGAGVTVLSPGSLRERMAQATQRLVNAYL